MEKKQQLHPFVKWAVLPAAAVGGLHLLSAFTLDTVVEHSAYSYRSPEIRPCLDGYTVAFVTDIHCYPLDKLQKLAGEIARRGPDLLLLGGDFPSSPRLSLCLDHIARIPTTDGIFSVAGNHDNAAALGAEARKRGIRLLRNQGVPIGDGLYLAGLEDLRKGRPDIRKALEGCEEGAFPLVFCHNPDTSMLDDFSAAPLTICGHTHGGELSLFGQWAPALYLTSHFGQRFAGGWCRSACGTDVLVSRGVGNHFPFRSFCRPQVLYLTLYSGQLTEAPSGGRNKVFPERQRIKKGGRP